MTVARQWAAADATCVKVYTNDGKFIGKGYLNDISTIAIRILTRDENEEINKEFFRKKLSNRITSYNVCYTKLLRVLQLHHQ